MNLDYLEQVFEETKALLPTKVCMERIELLIFFFMEEMSKDICRRFGYMHRRILYLDFLIVLRLTQQLRKHCMEKSWNVLDF